MTKWAKWLMGALVAMFAQSANAQYASAQEHRDYRVAPMKFYIAQVCASPASCKPIILALGTIQEHSMGDLIDFVKKHPQPKTIYFDSPGGNVQTAVKIGNWIRTRGYDTAVGGGARKMMCLSACPFAVMGGRKRTIEEGSSVGVHQFSSNNPAEAANVDLIKFVVTALSEYTRLMGVDPELETLAHRTKNEDMAMISALQARRWNLDNTRPAVGAWATQNALGRQNISVAQQQPGSDQMAFATWAKSPEFPGYALVVLHVQHPYGMSEKQEQSLMHGGDALSWCQVSTTAIKQHSCLHGQAIRNWEPVKNREGFYQAGYMVKLSDLVLFSKASDRQLITMTTHPAPGKKGQSFPLVFPTKNWDIQLKNWMSENNK